VEDEMKCIECGGKMSTARENFRHEALGLPLTLVGVEVSRCAACGLSEVAIPRLEELHRVIASALVNKPSSLTPGEIRFLRKQLAWSGGELADHLGVTRETVSRWEQGASPIGATADRLLRAAVALATPGVSLKMDTLRHIARGEPAPLQLRLHHDEQGWTTEAIETKAAKVRRRATIAAASK
jgi:putative zinc finger/helix-turn-helix YgiT family protein